MTFQVSGELCVPRIAMGSSLQRTTQYTVLQISPSTKSKVQVSEQSVVYCLTPCSAIGMAATGRQYHPIQFKIIVFPFIFIPSQKGHKEN